VLVTVLQRAHQIDRGKHRPQYTFRYTSLVYRVAMAHSGNAPTRRSRGRPSGLARWNEGRRVRYAQGRTASPWRVMAHGARERRDNW